LPISIGHTQSYFGHLIITVDVIAFEIPVDYMKLFNQFWAPL
jgi:hypothetical protein